MIPLGIMTKEEANNIIAENEAMVIGCTYNVLFTNDIVIGLTIEAVESIRKSPLYRFDTKRKVNIVEKDRLKYERMINEVIGNTSSFFADANDIFLEDIQKHVDILYYSIKREFDKVNLSFSDIIARMELAEHCVNSHAFNWIKEKRNFKRRISVSRNSALTIYV